MKLMRIIGAALLCSLFLLGTGSALPTPDEWRSTATGGFSALTEEEAASFIRPLVENNITSGIIVVLVDQSGYTWYAYGDLSTPSDSCPANQTLFDIGSISKVMTGLLMADAEERGGYNISAPVSTWLPAAYRLPGYEGIEITGADLATHRSGLPVTPDSFAMLDPTLTHADLVEASVRHYQTMTADETYAWLSNTSLLGPPGYEALYSNLGGAIAGDSVARAEGRPYPELFRERITVPLGLGDTAAAWSREDLERRAVGHRGYAYPADDARLIMFNGFWTATGGVHSSADDMAVFLAENLGLVDTPLATAIDKTHRPRAITWQSPLLMEQGLFWDILHNRDGTVILKKAGETNAHQAAIAFNPVMKAGVVILSDTATIGGIHVEEHAIALLERMQVKAVHAGDGGDRDWQEESIPAHTE